MSSELRNCKYTTDNWTQYTCTKKIHTRFKVQEILDVCIWCTQKEEFVTPAESGQVFEMFAVNSWTLLNSADTILAHVNQDVLRYDCKRPRLMSTSSYRFFGDHVNS